MTGAPPAARARYRSYGGHRANRAATRRNERRRISSVLVSDATPAAFAAAAAATSRTSSSSSSISSNAASHAAKHASPVTGPGLIASGSDASNGGGRRSNAPDDANATAAGDGYPPDARGRPRANQRDERRHLRDGAVCIVGVWVGHFF